LPAPLLSSGSTVALIVDNSVGAVVVVDDDGADDDAAATATRCADACYGSQEERALVEQVRTEGRVTAALMLNNFAQLGKLEAVVERGRQLQAFDYTGTSDPYCKVGLVADSGATMSPIYQTSVAWTTLNPVWSDGSFVFDVTDRLALELNMWDRDLASADDFMGFVRVPASEYSSASGSASATRWYPVLKLKKKRSKKTAVDKKKRGELFLRVKWIDFDALLLRPLVAPGLELARLLCRRVSSDAVATSLAVVLHGHSRLFDLIRVITLREVFATTDPNTLFRSTSMPTKLSTIYALLVGADYLRAVLGPVMRDFADLSVAVEPDPMFAEPGADIEANKANLLAFAQRFLDAITSSAERAPKAFRAVCRFLHETVARRWQEPYPRVAVGSFTMLRFFNPAIIAPSKYRLFEPLDDPADSGALSTSASPAASLAANSSGQSSRNRSPDSKKASSSSSPSSKKTIRRSRSGSQLRNERTTSMANACHSVAAHSMDGAEINAFYERSSATAAARLADTSLLDSERVPLADDDASDASSSSSSSSSASASTPTGPTTNELSKSLKRRLVLMSKILQNIANNGIALKDPAMADFNQFIAGGAQPLRDFFDELCKDRAPQQRSAASLTINTSSFTRRFASVAPCHLLPHLVRLVPWIQSNLDSISAYAKKLDGEPDISSSLVTFTNEFAAKILPIVESHHQFFERGNVGTQPGRARTVTSRSRLFH
jgi:C2 domain/GTPase-activator protein for Ras-like GTPase